MSLTGCVLDSRSVSQYLQVFAYSVLIMAYADEYYDSRRNPSELASLCRGLWQTPVLPLWDQDRFRFPPGARPAAEPPPRQAGQRQRWACAASGVSIGEPIDAGI